MTFKILGLDIEFPFAPYNVQKVMMNKVILTLTNKEHSLIESPTGTGKTLVLLCSVLAWRSKSEKLGRPFVSTKFQKKKLEERKNALKNKPCLCGNRPDNHCQAKSNDTDKPKNSCKMIDESVEIVEPSDVASHCQPSNKRIKMSTPPVDNCAAHSNGAHEVITIDDDEEWSDWSDSELESQCLVPKLDLHPNKEQNVQKEVAAPIEAKQNAASSEIGETVKFDDLCNFCLAIRAEEDYCELMFRDHNNEVEEDRFMDKTQSSVTKIPRIYYGTRTHKQITQVIRELNKTIYPKDLKMCILSSRDRTCINPAVKDLPNRNDKCKELLSNRKIRLVFKKDAENLEDRVNPTTCSYRINPGPQGDELIFEGLNDQFPDRAWDIEDAAEFGESVGCCPYYGTRALMKGASIVFCPYNYLLDPTIREVLGIKLKNSVIIFDEAHNIEDICRDSSSFSITSKNIDEILKRIERSFTSALPEKILDALNFFKVFFVTMKDWMLKQHFPVNESGSRFEKQKIIFSDRERDIVLEKLNIKQENLENLTANNKAITGPDEDDEEKKRTDNSEETTRTILEGHQRQLISQLIITLTYMYAQTKKNLSDFKAVITKSFETHQHKRNYGSHNRKDEDTYIWEFSLLCMNSGVSFEKVKKEAWSVIVASGTLSPIESLKTELGVDFEYSFEGNHVINRERVFASIISKGSKNVDLNCSWERTNNLSVQDEIGNVISDVCRVVPNGILVFFPSYDRMDSFIKRWTHTNTISAMKRFGKSVHKETKDLSAETFELELSKYRNNANITGAILFGVFRGKISEGIDFSDADARAVITIGIPYPNYKDINVNLKRDYNDKKAKLVNNTLLNGRDWYTAQAFRALNQALGRCIRHKEDWGAILMIDSRLNVGRSSEGISKWIRNNMDRYNSYTDTFEALQRFVSTRMEDCDRHSTPEFLAQNQILTK